jgi:hypothetical protein
MRTERFYHIIRGLYIPLKNIPPLSHLKITFSPCRSTLVFTSRPLFSPFAFILPFHFNSAFMFHISSFFVFNSFFTLSFHLHISQMTSANIPLRRGRAFLHYSIYTPSQRSGCHDVRELPWIWPY